jgi:hypothetical protein
MIIIFAAEKTHFFFQALLEMHIYDYYTFYLRLRLLILIICILFTNSEYIYASAIAAGVCTYIINVEGE